MVKFGIILQQMAHRHKKITRFLQNAGRTARLLATIGNWSHSCSFCGMIPMLPQPVFCGTGQTDMKNHLCRIGEISV